MRRFRLVRFRAKSQHWLRVRAWPTAKLWFVTLVSVIWKRLLWIFIVLFLVVFVVGPVVSGLSRPVVIVETIPVPKSFETRGYVSSVVTADVLSIITSIDGEAVDAGRKSRPLSVRQSAEADQQIDFQIPGTTLSFRQLAQFIRERYGAPPIRISIAIVDSIGNTWAVVRVTGAGVMLREQAVRVPYAVSNEPRMIRILERRIAEAALSFVEPAKLAKHLYYTTHREDDARSVLSKCVRVLRPPLKIDCLVGWGDIEADASNFGVASAKYAEALQWDYNSTEARAGVGWLKNDLGDTRDSIDWLEDH